MAPLWCVRELGVKASGASLWLNATFTAADVPCTGLFFPVCRFQFWLSTAVQTFHKRLGRFCAVADLRGTTTCAKLLYGGPSPFAGH